MRETLTPSYWVTFKPENQKDINFIDQVTIGNFLNRGMEEVKISSDRLMIRRWNRKDALEYFKEKGLVVTSDEV